MTDKITVRFAPDELSLGDLEDFEEYVGKSLDKALKPVKQYDEDGNLLTDEKGRPITEADPSPKVTTALVWINKRKEDSSFTIEDARQVRVGKLEIVLAEDDEVGND